jgi:hypothetical protein
VVDTRYFSTMEVPLIMGRNFTNVDTYVTQPVAVIDQTLARQYWPSENPLGRQIKFGFGRGTQGVTIVGAAGDIKSDGFEAPSVPHIYVALGQFAPVRNPRGSSRRSARRMNHSGLIRQTSSMRLAKIEPFNAQPLRSFGDPRRISPGMTILACDRRTR